MRVLPRTLRGRLIAGLLALLTAACATVGVVTYLAVQRSLSDELNNDLQTATGLAYQCYNPASKPPPGGGGGGQPALGRSTSRPAMSRPRSVRGTTLIRGSTLIG